MKNISKVQDKKNQNEKKFGKKEKEKNSKFSKSQNAKNKRNFDEIHFEISNEIFYKYIYN